MNQIKIKPLTDNFKCPLKKSKGAAAYDIYMPVGGKVKSLGDKGVSIRLGFASEIPKGLCAAILPRSGSGFRDGLALNNTVGIIDSDYRGEWIASLRVHNLDSVKWEAGDRLLQVMFIEVPETELILVDEIVGSIRGVGGFGSTGVR